MIAFSTPVDAVTNIAIWKVEAAAVGGSGGGGRSDEEGTAEADLRRAEAEENHPQQEPSIWPLMWHVGQFLFASFPRVNIQTISILQFCKQFSIHLRKNKRIRILTDG